MEGRLVRGRYRLDSRLGEGAMGVVYKAFDLVVEQVVAVKLTGLSTHHEASARFQREAQAMLALAHPNIVEVFDAGEDGGLNFIVMEYLSGKPLGQLLPLAIPDAVEVAIQIGAALAYAHGRGIVHRDIKPANLMVSPADEGRSGLFVKVTDFGLARRLEDQFQLTQSGMLVGTAAYVSPEQALGQRIDARSDLYSLGVVLYEMLTGQSPFPGDNVVSVIYQHLNEPPPSPRRLNPGIPPSLELVVLRLLRKEPAERYTSAADLVASLRAVRTELASRPSSSATGHPAPESLTIAISAPLVGREEEFALLKEIVRQVPGGEGQTVLLAGEQGIGKTRLVQETVAFARLHRYQAISAVCYEQEEGFPYQPFVDALRTYAARLTWQDAGVLRGATHGHGRELVALVPELARVYGESTSPAPPQAPEHEKARLFEATRQLIANASQLSPVVLLIDDLQWADASSLQLLQYIVRRSADRPILVLATFRTTEMSQQLSDFVSSLGSDGLHRHLVLEPLSPEKSLALVSALLGGSSVSSNVLEGLGLEAEGNPFFIVETVKHFVEEGLLAKRGGEWQALPAEKPRISASVRELVERRLAHFAGGMREILAIGAVIGRAFSLSLLKEVSSAGDADLLEALDKGLVSGLIRERPRRRDDQYDFGHALFREALYASLSSARRRSLHQQVGEALERRNAAEMEKAFGELAYHFSHGYDLDKAMKYSLLAGKQAAAVYASEDAFRYFEAARRLAQEQGRGEYLADIMEGLGQMAIVLGRFELAADSFRQAILTLKSQGQATGPRLARLRGQMSAACERLGRYGEALRELQEGLAEAGDADTVESAYLYGQLAVIRSRLGEVEVAMQYAAQDLRIAEKLASEEETAQACAILFKLHSLRGDWEGAKKLTERALAIWKKRDDIYRQGWNYLNLGAALWALGRWQEAEENWLTALDIGRSIHYPQGIVQNCLNLGLLCLRRGQFSPAEGYLEEALELAKGMGHPYYLARATMRTAELKTGRGETAPAMKLFAQAEGILRSIGHKLGLAELLWTKADAFVGQGLLDSAVEAAEEAVNLVPQPDAYEEVGHASRVLARVWLARGDRERAHQYLRVATECLKKLGDANGKAQVQVELARLLLSSGSPDDRMQAKSLLREALTDFEHLGAQPGAVEAKAMLRELGNSPNYDTNLR